MSQKNWFQWKGVINYQNSIIFLILSVNSSYFSGEYSVISLYFLDKTFSKALKGL